MHWFTSDIQVNRHYISCSLIELLTLGDIVLLCVSFCTVLKNCPTLSIDIGVVFCQPSITITNLYLVDSCVDCLNN